MAILSLPSWFRPQSFRMSLAFRTQIFQSELTGSIQTVALPGDKWIASITPPPLTVDQSREISAFLASLRGRSGRFYLMPYDHRVPCGATGGTPLVKGGSQSGTSLAIDGCSPNVTGWLKTGDYFQVGSELKKMTADANTNGAGETTLQFIPPLRTSPADNAPIITTNPACVAMLTDDRQASWAVETGKIYSIPFSCEEALDI